MPPSRTSIAPCVSRTACSTPNRRIGTIPVRHTLGAVLRESGRAGEAETVFWQDLANNPDNGFALRGLALSLRAQGKEDEASRIDERFARAWKDADVHLTDSRF